MAVDTVTMTTILPICAYHPALSCPIRRLTYVTFLPLLGKSNVYVICSSSGLAIAAPCADVTEQLPLGCQAASARATSLSDYR